MKAYCWASGLIEFGRGVPAGAIEIAQGRDKALRAFISGVARHGYKTRLVDGRTTKVRGTDHLLVPGVPEAPNQLVAAGALDRFLAWIGTRPPVGVTVTPPSRPTLEGAA